MRAATIVAGLYNANGGIDGKAVNFTDFHPEHSRDELVEDSSAAVEMLIGRAETALGLVEV